MTEQRTYTASEVASIVRGGLTAWAVAAVLFCAMPSLLIFVKIPEFESLFKGFGADLPATTQFFLSWRHILWVAPLAVVVLLYIAWTRPPEQTIASHRLIMGAIAGTCCASMVIQSLAVSALYAPIFNLGAVI